MKSAKIFVAFISLIFLGFGIASLFWTESLLGQADVTAVSSTGITELRAFYGGLEIGLGLALLGAAMGRWSVSSALMLIALAFGCIAIARIGSAVGLGDFSTWTLVASGFEVAASILAIVMRKRLSPSI